MSNSKRMIFKGLFYLVGASMLAYILSSIGISAIYQELLATDLSMVLLAMACVAVATVIRLIKFRVLLHGITLHAIIEIFTLSRIGKEVSFAGYFVPLLKKRNRSNGTFGNLIVDRFTEVLATLLFAFVACFIVLKGGYVESLVLAAVVMALLVMVSIIFFDLRVIRRFSQNRYVIKWIESITAIQEKIRFSSTLTIKVYVLSLLATALDFCGGVFVFLAYDVNVTFFEVAIVWASSGLVSMLLFMIMGSTEVSVIYLYDHLFNVAKVVTASTVIISRLLSLVILSFLFGYVVLTSGRQAPESFQPIDAANEPGM